MRFPCQQNCIILCLITDLRIRIWIGFFFLKVGSGSTPIKPCLIYPDDISRFKSRVNCIKSILCRIRVVLFFEGQIRIRLFKIQIRIRFFTRRSDPDQQTWLWRIFCKQFGHCYLSLDQGPKPCPLPNLARFLYYLVSEHSSRTREGVILCAVLWTFPLVILRGVRSYPQWLYCCRTKA